MKRLLLFTALALTFASAPVNGKPKDSNWQSFAYIDYRRHHPVEIIDDGDNFEALLSLIKPKSREYSAQLRSLKRNGLVKKGADGLWRTTISIFDEDQTVQLREFSKSISRTVYASVRDDFKSFVDILRKNGWEENTYSICFSYVLDGKMWDYIIDASKMESHHTWKGCIWYLYGRRDGLVPGTNTIGFLNQTWENTIQSRIDYSLLIDLANGLSLKGFPTLSSDVRDRAESAGLCDGDGKPLFPVIRDKEQTELASLADAIGKGIADEMKRHIDESPLLESIKEKGAAEVILSHELIWDIMDRLEADGIIRRPAFLRLDADNAPVDLSKLIYLEY